MKLPPSQALGATLADMKAQLGITETGEATEYDGETERWVFPAAGVEALLENERVATIFLHAEGHDGFPGYAGDTGDVTLDSTKQVVRFKLGQPSRSREGETEAVLGTVPNFDRYDYDAFSVHVAYDESGQRVRMLTFMIAEVVRRIEGHSRPDGPVVYDKAKYHLDSVLELGLDEAQSAVHTACFLGWLMDRDLLSREFVDDSAADIDAYKQREMTALDVYANWDYCLVDDMLNAEGNAFAQHYFDFSNGKYIDDYVELLVGSRPNMFEVPYTWEHQETISHRISERYREWKDSGSPVPTRPQERKHNEARTQRRLEKAKRREAARRVAPSPPEPAAVVAAPRGRPSLLARHPKLKRLLLIFVLFPVLFLGAALLVLIWANSL